jgi:hypothetical protein
VEAELAAGKAVIDMRNRVLAGTTVALLLVGLMPGVVPVFGSTAPVNADTPALPVPSVVVDPLPVGDVSVVSKTGRFVITSATLYDTQKRRVIKTFPVFPRSGKATRTLNANGLTPTLTPTG